MPSPLNPAAKPRPAPAPSPPQTVGSPGQQQAPAVRATAADIGSFERSALRPTETVFTAEDGHRRTVAGLGQAGDGAAVIKEEHGARPDYLQSTSEKQLDFTPTQRFATNDPAATKFLEQEGYVVIAGAASAEEVRAAKETMWAWLEDAGRRYERKTSNASRFSALRKNRGGTALSRHGPIDRSNPLTWEEGWPASGSTGILSGHGFNHSDFMWTARTNPTVLQTFSRVWGTPEEELIASFDGGNIFRPTEPSMGGQPEWTTMGGWWHVDQNTLCGHVGRCTIQGLLTYTDADETTGGLCVVPKSHNMHDELCARAAHAGLGDFVTVPASDPVLDAPGRLICAKAGDLLLWDSRTVHCNTPALRPSAAENAGGLPAQLKRIVAYVCLVPRSLATPATLARRRDAYESNTGSSHWPQDLTLGAPGEAFGLPTLDLDQAPLAVQRLVDGGASGSREAETPPPAEAMAAMDLANRAEAEGDLVGAKRWIAEAERLGHSLLAKYGGWR